MKRIIYFASLAATTLCYFPLAMSSNDLCDDDEVEVHCSVFENFPSSMMLKFVMTLPNDSRKIEITDCHGGDVALSLIRDDIPLGTYTIGLLIQNDENEFDPILEYAVEAFYDEDGRLEADPRYKNIDMSSYKNYPECE